MEVDNCVEHKGIVKEIIGGKAIVQLNDELSCASCSAKGSCMALTEKQDKLYEFDAQKHGLETGNVVKVRIQKSKGMEALFYGYILPLLLILFSLIVLKSFGYSDGKAGLISISMLVPFYAGLYFFNKKLKEKFSFSVEKLNE